MWLRTFGARTRLAVLGAVALCGPCAAQQCGARAVGADGQPLKGAARTAFLKKCIVQDCLAMAVDKDGKPLAGAARAAFLRKCDNGA